LWCATILDSRLRGNDGLKSACTWLMSAPLN
jgi:hypothetical protein